MILVHKPVSFSPALSSHHRRLPSAPAVVVQPTRTPGLLSVKPQPRPTTPRLPQQRIRAPFKKPAAPSAEKQRPTQPTQPLLSEEDEKVTKPNVRPNNVLEKPNEKVPSKMNPTSTSPDKSLRGRQHKLGKDKPAKRSVSLSSARPQFRRQPRQPSPIRIPSQAEVPARPASINSNPHQSLSQRARNTNAFDPFLASSSDTDFSDSKPASKKPAPKLVSPRVAPQLSKPSGKLAYRRRALDSPTLSKSIPVPRSKGRSVAAVGLSRSAPVGQIPVRSLAKRFQSNKGQTDTDMFPICDDLTDIDGEGSRPSTPIRKPAAWQQHSSIFEGGPRTAPLSSTMHSFPFNVETPTPSPLQARRSRHARAPSEGVFNMSFDEDSSSSDASEELKALFAGMLSKKRRLNKSSTEDLSRSEAEKAAYFASSMFQNSPSPDDLPAPAFMH